VINIEDKEIQMSLEQTIKETLIAESVDLDVRLQQLVRAGLMPANTLPLLRKGITKVQAGYPLQGAERDVMANFLNAMMFIVLGDDAIFNKARVGAKVTHQQAQMHRVDEAKEKQEYDYEGDMAMSQLKSIIANSQRMHDSMSEDTNLPEWVQSKITLAEDYISTAANYLQGEVNEGKRGLWDNIHAKRKRIKAGSGERMRKPGSEGAPTAADFKNSRTEEVEVIDELSRATVGRYSMKAKSIADNEGGKDRTKGRELAGRKKWGGTMSGVKKAKVMATEEAEQIDELSKKTLASYINKSTQNAVARGIDYGYSKDSKDSANALKKLPNRVQGIKKATDKLTKESRRAEALADIAAVTQMNESYKTTFNAALEQFNIKSPSELDEEKRKEFFNFVDQNYKKGDK
jgi:hypothetical protein